MTILLLPWDEISITFTCKAEPNDSGTQIPTTPSNIADWTAAVAEAVGLNYQVDQDFVVPSSAAEISGNLRKDIENVPYDIMSAEIRNGQTYLHLGDKSILIPVFGKHNLQNMAGAWEICKRLDISKSYFIEAMQSFKGTGNRLEVLSSNDQRIVYRDFAHAPSKVKATVEAVKEQYPDKKLYACLELHTFSSLNKEFMSQYSGSMDKADEAVVFFNPDVVKHKKLPEISSSDILESFERDDLKVYSDTKDLQEWYDDLSQKEVVVLMMSSGAFGGVKIK